MDLNKILKDMENCPCGRVHTFDTKVVEIGSGITAKTGKILADAGFPKTVLLVADENTLAAADGILPALKEEGFHVKKLVYENMKSARVEQVVEIEALAEDVDGIISVGTGSLNDLCRVASFRKKKMFCIFATAPSMDGFASDTAPIIENNFKSSWQAAQPAVIIADTKILAAAPVELKSSGFGDMVAKYIGLVDWKLSTLLTGEYYCENIANLTKTATDRIMDLAERVTENSEEAAGAIMESLVMTGLAMKLAGCSRPASGAEHVVSHYLECYKVIRGIWPDYHGKKVGVATVLLNRAYHNIADRVESVTAVPDATDWDEVYSKYDAVLHDDIKKLNNPTVTDEVDPADLQAKWPEIRRIIKETLPTDEVLMKKMKAAGAVVDPEAVHVPPALLQDSLRFHPYMRHRMLLTRLMPMLNLDIMDFID
ncbi:MAG: iron-containing alcohol dehydrogenase [Clostridia bacterium]|nr:iron-containing alcohol dehydrogenase [Clostridia bacterium]